MKGEITGKEFLFLEEFKAFREEFYYPEMNEEFWKKVVERGDEILLKLVNEPFFDFASNLVFSEMKRMYKEASSNPILFGENGKEEFLFLSEQ